MIPEPLMRQGQPLDVRDLFALSFGMNDLDREVRPIESADKRGRLYQTQLLNDVRAHVGRGRRRQGQSLHAAKRFDRPFQL